MAKQGINSVEDLVVYILSQQLSKEIFLLTLTFPKEEKYSLSDQIRRSSRSIPGNISEGFAKRSQEALFKHNLLIASGSLSETKTWLESARDYSYISEIIFRKLYDRYHILGGMLYRLHQNWHTPKKKSD
jgi:four helix bundle protein